MKIIIGGGISGLIHLFYSGEDTICISSGSKSEFSPFVFLHDLDLVRSFLRDLNMDFDLLPVEIIIDKGREEIINDKVSLEEERWFIGTDKIAGVQKGMILNSVSVSVEEVKRKLQNKLKKRIIYAEVVSIKQKEFGFLVDTNSGEKISCEEIISSVPFFIFQKICPFWFPGDSFQKEEFYYSIEKKKVPKSFIEYPKKGNLLKIVENSITGEIGKEFSESTACSKTGIRTFGILNPPPDNIKFIGRGATANPHWRIEDSIFCAKKGLIFSELLNEQIRFSKALLKNFPSSKESRINSLLLHLYSEVGELQRETNWKTNEKYQRRIKATSILEEAVDCIKLIFDILSNFNYTDREIFHMWENKSEKVWSRLLDNFYGGV